MSDAAPEIQLLPNGRLIIPNPENLPAFMVREFGKSTANGLLSAASEGFDVGLAPGLAFWRSFAHDFLTALCHSPTDDEWEDVPPPALAHLVAKAPPAPGMEYLDENTLRDQWDSLNRVVSSEISTTEGGLDAWLRSRNPIWRLVGRVTFHLAENRRSESFPFAFLATYTHRISSQARLQHLPLGKALKQYAGAKDTRSLRSLLEPVQKAAETSEFAAGLLESRKVFHALAWTPSEAHRFLHSVPELENAGIIVKVPDWWKGGRPPRPKVSVTLDTGGKTSVGFDALVSFKTHLSLEGEKLTEEEIEKILNSRSHLVTLKGRWVEIDPEKLQQVLEQWQRAQSAASTGALTFLQGMRMLSGFRLTTGIESLDAALEAGGDWSEITAADRLKELLESIRDPSRLGQDEPDEALEATLRPYQIEGQRWLQLFCDLGMGACLADDMGLGKTIQVLALLLATKRRSPDHPALLIVPASLMGNWKAEFERFAPSLDVFYAHRSLTPEDELAETIDRIGGRDAVITTYSMLRRLPALSEAQWDLVVLDEAQAIKNPQSKQTKAVKSLNSRCRLALTGTPIENNIGDLWSLFDFLNPGLLGTANRFVEVTKTLLAGDEGYAPLRRLVSPYILRRLKTDRSIIDDLPEKTEIQTRCPLTKGQAALYRKSVEQLASELNDPKLEGIKRSGLVLTYLMRFKQICNHPALWTGSGNFEPKDSGKYRRLRAITEEVAARGEKTLVFTQFREMAAPLAEFLEVVFGRRGLVLHGGTPVGRRQELVDQFQNNAGPPFFVISLKAGGTGLNLTAASHVIHFDRWWNPAVENQATDRAFRIGQKRNVLVHKFVCAGTIEEKIDRLLSEKQELADELLDTGAQKALTEMGNDELVDFVSLDIDSAVF